MYLSVKKKDSVTSILLFIFNVFLVERGITAVPLKKIFGILEPFHKNETAIRMGLSRGIQNGVLASEKRGNEVYYLITGEAVQGVKYWQETLAAFRSRIPLQLSGWDGEWSILWADSSGGKKSPGGLADSLRQSGYGSLGGSLWISPYDLTGRIEEIAKKHGLEKYYQFRGRLAGDKSPEDMAAGVWPVKELSTRYSAFLKSMNEAAGRLDADSGNGGGGLPFLHLHGLDFFEIIQDDPQLPLEMLPRDWPGLKAAKGFLEVRERILPEAGRFIEERLYG